MIRTVKEEYYATHGGGPVCCLSYSLRVTFSDTVREISLMFVSFELNGL